MKGGKASQLIATSLSFGCVFLILLFNSLNPWIDVVDAEFVQVFDSAFADGEVVVERARAVWVKVSLPLAIQLIWLSVDKQ